MTECMDMEYDQEPTAHPTEPYGGADDERNFMREDSRPVGLLVPDDPILDRSILDEEYEYGKSIPIDGDPPPDRQCPEWMQNVEPAGTPVLAAAGVLVALLLGAFALVFVAGETDAFDRFDEHHPGHAALSRRHFSAWTPFHDDGFDCILRTQLRAAGELPDSQSREWRCRYRVPYPAVFAAMCASFLGLIAVCRFAWTVLAQPRGSDAMSNIARTVHESAMQFVKMEYLWLVPCGAAMWLFLFLAIDGPENGWVPAASVSFLLGAVFSAAAGYLGMVLATEGNCRTAAACGASEADGLERGLRVALRTGACMGVSVASLSTLGLSLSYAMFGNTAALGGFGLGASALSLFARTAGGIYAKSAGISVNLCSEICSGLREHSPKNPAAVAAVVGASVGNVAGVGADLFESLCGAVVAAAVLGAAEFGEDGVAVPFYLLMVWIVASVACTGFLRVLRRDAASPGPSFRELLASLRLNVLLSAFVVIIATLFLTFAHFDDAATYLDNLHDLNSERAGWEQTNAGARVFGAVLLGLTCGILIGFATEYFTSQADEPARAVAAASAYGPGPVVIQGLGVGMLSAFVPAVLVAASVLGAFHLAGFYGVAVGCVGMLSTSGVVASVSAFGAVAENSADIAKMTSLPQWVRAHTDALDGLGGTTTAAGAGYANGCAALSAFALLAAFMQQAGLRQVNLLRPAVVCGLLLGALLPYVVSAMTLLSVNKAAREIMLEVRAQYLWNPAILTETTVQPDYPRCIAISCEAALREMALPSILATAAPLIIGFGLGSEALAGALVGAISVGYLMSSSHSNSGGAWANAKRLIEEGRLRVAAEEGGAQGKGSTCHQAAVCGDVVGEPLKDTTGPSVIVLVKLMTRFSFVLAPLFETGWGLWHVGVFVLVGTAVLIVVLQYTLLKDLPIDNGPASAGDAASNPDPMDYEQHSGRKIYETPCDQQSLADTQTSNPAHNGRRGSGGGFALEGEMSL
ncbi:putative K(+)-stimulated pyrophosphate-energized sodium pump [Diplonema papillatum]|nr:putative K(+)-stimulated pyrophosphate-energized sodium pump [Diplonema papillatum]